MKMMIKSCLYSLQVIIYLNVIIEVRANPMFGAQVKNVRRGQFTYIAALTRIRYEHLTPTEYHICTGSLITRQDVLIAAHCFDGESASTAIVRVGSIKLSTGTKYDLLWWVSYNDWMRRRSMRQNLPVNDIGIIRLRRRVPSNLHLGVLSQKATMELYNQDVKIAAWGFNEEERVPDKMRIVGLKILEQEACIERVSQLNESPVSIHPKHFCSNAYPYAVMHYGDSGAPVIHDGEIIAVHKSTLPFPNNPLNPLKINIHTNINYYRDFIETVMDPNYHWF